ncbi:hypothetical protein SDC9_180591 [bioreactor metagenome]|uniref:Uncharacterized protein n=1 Tax=bioreactor metagenome TaxID=1076179 RepID=A0A645H274_9ZZZZ
MAGSQTIINDQHAQGLDVGDVEFFRRVEVVHGGIQGARQLLLGEGLGDDGAGAGLADRFEQLRPGFAGDQDEGNGFQHRLGTHRHHQFGARHVRQVEAADHHLPGIGVVQRGKRRARRGHCGHPPDALVFEHARDEVGLHLRRLDQQDDEFGQRGSQGHAVLSGNDDGPHYSSAALT